ncbi:methyltransferase [Shewanella acanthi]|uniref:methyltransferase n=1 Tax=Shewanella acanthi TaxID=2864212 RepID=UPI001C6577BF|nr:methyltransferase [Shewanella acanthi]QYJ77742.1 SAM-dependent methyltransferase [Shewanella acanthi]
MKQINYPSSHRLLEYFTKLNQLLEKSTPLWQVRAFEAKALPWEGMFPSLAKAVWTLDDDKLDGLDANQAALVEALAPALTEDLAALGVDWDLSLLTQTLSDISGAVLSKTNELDTKGLAHFSAHIKGRKWEQITAFVQHLPQYGLPVLEWCAGKGHLGRLIAKSRGVDVVSLEWQEALCEEGQAFAEKWHLTQQFVCADAFAIEPKGHRTRQQQTTNPFREEQQAVALHACGDLHVRLLQLAATANTQALAISPCCYHLIHAEQYQGLSSLAKASALRLSRHDLQLPLQQSVIANPKQQSLRLREIAWRLGFDALQRECRGIDAYLPLPAIKQSQLSDSFEAFCHWAAQQKSVSIGNISDFQSWLAIGQQRQQLTRRIDLVAHLFRQVLEQWLILDRCCFLQEQGYRVQLGEFCPNSVTPRNALILAFKTTEFYG